MCSITTGARDYPGVAGIQGIMHIMHHASCLGCRHEEEKPDKFDVSIFWELYFFPFPIHSAGAKIGSGILHLELVDVVGWTCHLDMLGKGTKNKYV